MLLNFHSSGAMQQLVFVRSTRPVARVFERFSLRFKWRQEATSAAQPRAIKFVEILIGICRVFSLAIDQQGGVVSAVVDSSITDSNL